MSNQTPPQPPDGCVYGPMWDSDKALWFYLDDFGQVFYFSGSAWFRASSSECARKLLRLAGLRLGR